MGHRRYLKDLTKNPNRNQHISVPCAREHHGTSLYIMTLGTALNIGRQVAPAKSPDVASTCNKNSGLPTMILRNYPQDTMSEVPE